jgi:hypothetical protein
MLEIFLWMQSILQITSKSMQVIHIWTVYSYFSIHDFLPFPLLSKIFNYRVHKNKARDPILGHMHLTF